MRAYTLAGPGAEPALADVDAPEPGPDEVRVQVHAASVNGFDLAVAHGYLVGVMEHRYPVVLGKDFAGVVDAIGSDVTGHAVGDRVFGVVSKPSLGDGSFGQYVTVPTQVGLAHLPDGIDFATGAALGLAGTAALQALDAAAVAGGEVVLIMGATGGVGTQLLQLAKDAGATVLATGSGDAAQEHLLSLGADVVVDHADDLVAATLAAQPAGVDVVFHLAGDPEQALSTVRAGGRFVSTIVQPGTMVADGIAVHCIYAQPDGATLTRLATRLESDPTSVRIQQTFPLEQTAEALAAFSSGTIGKIVITTA